MNDCVHDWRLERIGENSETGSWQARCKECNGIDSPGVMNEQADIRQDEIDLMVDMLDCYAEQIDNLTASLASRRFYLQDREVRRRVLEWQKEHGDVVEGLTEFIHSLVGDDPEDIERWEKLVEEP